VSRPLHILSVVLITAGIVILADVATTLLWKEPVSSIYASIRQHDASDQLAETERRFPAAPDLRAVRDVHGTAARARALARRFALGIHDGDAVGRVVIPAIDLNVVAVQGTDTADLEAGPGHYLSTPLPGQPGTTAFAGHRTTYLAPFRHLDSLRPGDVVELDMPYASLRYRIQHTRIVSPSDVGILHPVGYQRLVLTACNPLYSASQRIAVFAKLDRVSSVDTGGARGGASP
jgi:sortase A